MDAGCAIQDGKDRRYSKAAFWLVKVIGLMAVAAWLWNVGKETGRQEILDKKPVQYVLNNAPFCFWGGFVYPATGFKMQKQGGVVNIKNIPDTQ